MTPRIATRGWLALIGLLLATATLANAVPVAAHAFLVQTTPRPGERLDSGPPGIQLRFSEPVVTAELDITRQHELAVPHDEARRSQDGLLVEAHLPELGDGIYIVAYEVVANDGHVTSGEYAFAVGDVDEMTAPEAGAAQGSASRIPWLPALARWLLVAGLLIAVGALVSERLVWHCIAPESVSLPILPIGGFITIAALGATSSLIGLVLGPGDGADVARFAERIRSVPAIALAAQLLLLALASQLLWLSRLRSWILLPLAAALGMAALTGHSAGLGAGPAAANVVHLAGVALWTGGLLHVGIVVWRFRGAADLSWVRRGVGRYATMALAVVVVVLISGALLALTQFRRPGELVDTAYGRLLLVKLALVAVALGLALLARLRGLGDTERRVSLLSRVTRLEALMLIGVLGLASVIATATPPSAVRGAAYLLGPPPLEGPVLRSAGLAGSTTVHLAAAPGRLELRALGFSGEGIEGAELRLTAVRPDGAAVDLQSRDCGPGCWTTAVAWTEGTTTMRAETSAPDWPSGTLQFDVTWPPEPEAPQRLQAVMEAMGAVPSLVMSEDVSSGPGMTGPTYTLRDSGAEFVARELYASGGATDIHPVPPRVGDAALTLYLPGSTIWFRLELDERDRIAAETIVSPGHLIERTFRYPGG